MTDEIFMLIVSLSFGWFGYQVGRMHGFSKACELWEKHHKRMQELWENQYNELKNEAVRLLSQK